MIKTYHIGSGISRYWIGELNIVIFEESILVDINSFCPDDIQSWLLLKYGGVSESKRVISYFDSYSDYLEVVGDSILIKEVDHIEE